MDRRILAVAAGFAVMLAVVLSRLLTPDTGDLPQAPAPAVVPVVVAKTPTTNTVQTSGSPAPEPAPKATPDPPESPPNVRSAAEIEASMALPVDLQMAIGSWDDHQLRPERLDDIEAALGEALSSSQQRELVVLFTSQSDQSARLIAEFRMGRVDADEAANIIHEDLAAYRDQLISITGLAPDDYDEVFAPPE